MPQRNAINVSNSNEGDLKMAYSFFEPATRLWQRWQTEHVIAHLDRHLIEDAGIKTTKTIWGDLNVTRRGYWSGKR